MRLADQVKEAGTRLAVPLMGSVGARLAGLKIGECLQEPGLHLKALAGLVDEFRPSALLPIMDLTREVEALGVPITVTEDEPPSVAGHPVTDAEKLKELHPLDPARDGRLPGCLEVAEKMRELTPGLTGFYAIGPFTLAAELAGAEELAVRTITEPSFAAAVIDFSLRSVVAYATRLAERVDLVVILEPSAVMLSPAAFGRFALPALAALMEEIRAAGACPVLHVCGDTSHLMESMAACGADGYSLDAPVDLKDAAGIMGSERVVMGNIDPVGVMLEAGPDKVEAACEELLGKMEGSPSFILAPGCDLPADTPVANIHSLLESTGP